MTPRLVSSRAGGSNGQVVPNLFTGGTRVRRLTRRWD